MDSRDFGTSGLNLNAVSTGGVASGYFDYLRFTRSSGEVQLSTEQAMEASYASSFPSVQQHQGLEISLTVPHINWYGSGVVLTDYGTVTAVNQAKYQAFLQTTVIPQIHAAGGLVSYNHPYGVSSAKALPKAAQDHRLATLAAAMLEDGALGADLLEVGYLLRAGVDLGHHVGLWDVLSRNAIFLTGNGTTDDHVGTNWLRSGNNWFTSVWAASSAEADLLNALAAGRGWCGSLPWFRGNPGLLIDGACPMGSVSISTLPSRQTADRNRTSGQQRRPGAPGHRGLRGNRLTHPDTLVIATYSTVDLAGGSVSMAVDNSVSSFVRTQVVDSTGVVIALSNPAWLLRVAPPGGIPIPRSV